MLLMTPFALATRDLIDVQARFSAGEVSSFDHARIRDEALGSAISAMANELGVKLKSPIHINSRGEYDIFADGGHYGQAFAAALDKHNPRTGIAPGARISADQGWCFLNHFEAEKMVMAYRDAQHKEWEVRNEAQTEVADDRGEAPRG